MDQVHEVHLTLTPQHAVLVQLKMHQEYISFCTMADSFERHGSPGLLENVGATFREHAELCRQIGQQVEVLIPEVEQQNWRWPQ